MLHWKTMLEYVEVSGSMALMHCFSFSEQGVKLCKCWLSLTTSFRGFCALHTDFEFTVVKFLREQRVWVLITADSINRKHGWLCGLTFWWRSCILQKWTVHVWFSSDNEQAYWVNKRHSVTNCIEELVMQLPHLLEAPTFNVFFYSVRALHTAGLHLLVEQTVCRVTNPLAAHYGRVLIPSSSLPTALVWWSFCKVTFPKLAVFCAVHYHFKFVTLMSVSKQKRTTHIQNSHFTSHGNSLLVNSKAWCI